MEQHGKCAGTGLSGISLGARNASLSMSLCDPVVAAGLPSTTEDEADPRKSFDSLESDRAAPSTVGGRNGGAGSPQA